MMQIEQIYADKKIITNHTNQHYQRAIIERR